jgi:hypothetical protein
VSNDDDHMDPGRVLIHDLIGEELDDPEAIRADVQEIKLAAERAIAMTDQLPRPGKVSP